MSRLFPLMAVLCAWSTATAQTNKIARGFAWQLGSQIPHGNIEERLNGGKWCAFQNTNFPPFKQFFLEATESGVIFSITGTTKMLPPIDFESHTNAIVSSLKSKYKMISEELDGESPKYVFGDEHRHVTALFDATNRPPLIAVIYSDEDIRKKHEQSAKGKQESDAKKAASKL